MIMFIASEVMFCAAWFWAFFDRQPLSGEAIQAARAEFTGGVWRPRASRSSIPGTCRSTTPSSCCSPARRRPGRTMRCCTTTARALVYGLTLTVLLGVLFSYVQGYEYAHAPFAFKDSIYGATFFMATASTVSMCWSARSSCSSACCEPCGRLHAEAPLRLRSGGLVLAFRRRRLAVPLLLHLTLGWLGRADRPRLMPFLLC